MTGKTPCGINELIQSKPMCARSTATMLPFVGCSARAIPITTNWLRCVSLHTLHSDLCASASCSNSCLGARLSNCTKIMLLYALRMDAEGKVIVVIGGAGGIGKMLCVRFAAERAMRPY